MKKMLLRRLLSGALSLTLLTGIPAFAAGNADSDTGMLMEQSVSTDGAGAESIAYELYRQFTDAPADFLTELAAQPDNIRQTVVQFIAGENYYGDTTPLSDILQNLPGLSDTQQNAADELLQYWAELQAQPQGDASEDDGATLPLFDVETMRSFIDLNRGTDDPYADEQFCVRLAEAYAADPTAFGGMIADTSEAEIARLADQIVYAVQNGLADVTLPAQTSNAPAALYALQQAIASTDAPARTNVGAEEDATFPSQARSTYVPTIGTMSYSGSLEVGKTVTLSAVISESAHTASTRSYYVVAMGAHSASGTYYKKAEGSLTIPAGSASATKTFSVVMSDPGPVYTKIVVYSSNGGSQLASRVGAYPDTFTGKWRIQINLNSSSRAGYLGLYNAAGTNILYIPCLGRSESNGAEDVYHGNTPRGNYFGYLGGPDSNEHSYGPYKYVVLEGNNNPLVPSKRDGIWIHGGDPSSSGGLRVTYGCVRVSNPNQKAIQDNITSLVNNYHASRGNVNIAVGNY